jgi:hypothetical protein
LPFIFAAPATYILWLFSNLSQPYWELRGPTIAVLLEGVAVLGLAAYESASWRLRRRE